MKCEICEQEGNTSTAYPNGCIATAMNEMRFYDDGGAQHIHDPNTIIHHYYCTHGHHWTVKTKHQPCPVPDCEWNNNLERE